MPLIETLDTVHVRLPRRREHRWAGLQEDIGGFILVRVGSGGRFGWGEAPVLKDWGGDWGRYFGEAPDTTRMIIERYLAPAVKGQEALHVGALHDVMDRSIKGYPYAKAAVEMAVLDLAARSLDVPVHVLLGGRVRDRIAVSHSIGLLPIEEAVSECVQVAREGIRTIKVKVGELPARDIEVVRRIREAIGPEMNIAVDANRGWPNVATAVRTIRAMEPYNILYAEQPVEGAERLAQIAERVSTPIMADESAWNSRDALEIALRGGVEIISIYTTKPGGLRRGLEVAAVARAAGIACNLNGSVETGIGNLANIQLAASAPAVTVSCVVPLSTPAEFQNGNVGGIYYTDDLIIEPFKFADGFVRVPDAPGMGIAVDERKIERYRIA